MARGDGRTAPASLEAWRQRVADDEERIAELEQENDELRSRLEEIAAIAAPDQVELARQDRERMTRIEELLAQVLQKKVVTIDGSAERA